MLRTLVSGTEEASAKALRSAGAGHALVPVSISRGKASRHTRRKVESRSVCFPGYVFYAPLSGAPAIPSELRARVSMLRFGDAPARLRREDVRLLEGEFWSGFERPPEPMAYGFSIGDMVRLLGQEWSRWGIMKLVEIRDGLARLEFELFGSVRMVEVDLSRVRLAE